MDPFDPATPDDSPLTMRDVQVSPKYRALSTPRLRVGDPAFPFTLDLLDFTQGTPQVTGKTVSLGSFRGERPVALIFGSYT